MPTPSPSAAVRPIDRIMQAIMRRLQSDSAGEHHAGMFAYQDTTQIDDEGGYGDPHEDSDKPDWIKQDEIGWTKLTPR